MNANKFQECIKRVTRVDNLLGWEISSSPSTRERMEEITLKFMDKYEETVYIGWDKTEDESMVILQDCILKIWERYKKDKSPENSMVSIPILRYRELLEHENVYNDIMKLVSASTTTKDGQTH
jgi:hypothetical protein